MNNPDPLDQLAEFRSEMDAETRARHLSAIGRELRRQPPPVEVRRRWMLGVVIAMMLAGPAAAVAGDGAAPGDLLYPIKLAVEPIVRLFDRDVVAEHRVEEVGVLIDREAEDALIEERIGVARDALAETDAPRFEQELDRIVDRWVSDRPPARPLVTDEPAPTTGPTEPVSEPTDRGTELQPLDTPTTTTTSPSRDLPPPSTTTSTTQPIDRSTPGDRPRDTP